MKDSRSLTLLLKIFLRTPKNDLASARSLVLGTGRQSQKVAPSSFLPRNFNYANYKECRVWWAGSYKLVSLHTALILYTFARTWPKACAVGPCYRRHKTDHAPENTSTYAWNTLANLGRRITRLPCVYQRNLLR